MAERTCPVLSYTRQVLLDGYESEKKRMSNIKNRCHHHHIQFDDCPKKMASYVMKILYLPLKQLRGTDTYTFQNWQEADRICKIVSNGFCELCAMYLAPKIKVFFRRLFSLCSSLTWSTCNILSYICAIILHYPSVVARYCKEANLFWNDISIVLIASLQLHHLMITDSAKKAKLTDHSYNALSRFGTEIIRSSHMLKTFDHLNANLVGFLRWLPKDIRIQMNCNLLGSLIPFLNVSLMLLSYFHLIERKQLLWNQEEISRFRQQMYAIIKATKTKVETHLGVRVAIRNRTLKYICLDLLFVTDPNMEDRRGAMRGYRAEFKKIKRAAWEEKKREMQCLWKKCNVRAKDMDKDKLYKCSRCKVARYCSRRCQKKDWNIGCHKELCVLCRI